MKIYICEVCNKDFISRTRAKYCLNDRYDVIEKKKNERGKKRRDRIKAIATIGMKKAAPPQTDSNSTAVFEKKVHK